MKALLRKYLRYFLIGSIALLIVLTAVGLVLVIGWPWWVSIFLLLLLAGLGIGAFTGCKIWQRRNSLKFVDEVIENDRARMEKMSVRERDDLKALQGRWKKDIERLRKSHLKKLGNPLYVLPWFIIIGESGSGKTTSLSSARLSKFSDLESPGSISGTKDCDWWFLDKSIIIDTAGRYAIPVNGGPDRKEWHKFVSLLLKYRKREPLNGVIVTIAADKLLCSPPEKIEGEGKIIRRRIDELMIVLGLKLPVYLLVTKCDLIQGMNSFSEKFSDDILRQPMGMMNQDLSADVDAFLNNAMSAIGKRLRNLRLLLLHQSDSKGIDRSMLLFPEEYGGIKEPLKNFVRALFGQNPYQETPIFRGLYFGSGRQQGCPFSSISKTLDIAGESKALPDTTRGLFLHEFFSSILPKDKDILMPTKRATEWNSLAGNLGLVSWVIVCIAMCGLLSFSFVKNMKTISGMTKMVGSLPVMTGDFMTDMASLEKFRQEIIRVEEQNSGWWIPRFGLRESIHVEKMLKDKFCKQFHSGFMQPFDAKMEDSIKELSPSCTDERYAQYMDHLVRRINLLRAAQDDPKPKNMSKRIQPSYVFIGERNANPENGRSFGKLYFHYLAWRADNDLAKKEIAILQDLLKRVYSLRSSNLDWVMVLVDRQQTVPGVTLEEFWGGTQTVPGEKHVQPSFTVKGKQAIDCFQKELEEAYPEAAALAQFKGRFEERYRTLSFDAWKSFADAFSAGAGRLKDSREARETAVKMAADGGAYFAFLDRISLEMEPLVANGAPPAWVAQVYRFQALKLQGAAQQAGVVGKAAEAGRGLLADIEKKLGKEAGGKKLELQISAGAGIAEYRSSLAAITPLIATRNQAYQLTAQTFNGESALGKSPFIAGYAAIERIKNGLGQGVAPDATVRSLVSGPLDYLWLFARKETSAYLDAQWNETVLAPVKGLNNQQASQLLGGPDGAVTRFAKGPAAPFLSRDSKSGFRPKEVLGGLVPLDRGFYKYLNDFSKNDTKRQIRPQQFNVGIHGLPTEANPEAVYQPHCTRVELQCGANSQTLVNQNYSVSKTFTWSAETCSDVVLQIEVSDIVLTKHYSGQQAFPEFLKDFRNGSRTFAASDFLGEQAALKSVGIKWIQVNYQFKGSSQVALSFESMPVLPPNIGGK